jgi:two-component system sensor kinase FixL
MATSYFGSEAALRKRAEDEVRKHRDELLHMDRIAMMGELTASLPHELNQPLSAILSNAQAAQRFFGAKPPDLDEVHEALTDIIEAHGGQLWAVNNPDPGATCYFTIPVCDRKRDCTDN